MVETGRKETLPASSPDNQANMHRKAASRSCSGRVKLFFEAQGLQPTRRNPTMADTKPDPKAVLEFAKENSAKLLDLRFTDLPGLWHHVSFPIGQFSEASFEDGFGMDGSSIRGWAAIHESDMLLIPDPNFYIMDPFTEAPTLVMVADVIDPVTKQRYDRDPRYIAKKAEMYLISTGMADT